MGQSLLFPIRSMLKTRTGVICFINYNISNLVLCPIHRIFLGSGEEPAGKNQENQESMDVANRVILTILSSNPSATLYFCHSCDIDNLTLRFSL